MKKAVNISIAQTLFMIEEDAFAKLDDYLKSIRTHFAYIEDSQEVIDDIESRITEQFLETKKKILTLKEIETVIHSMGTVADFEEGEIIPHVEAEEVAPKQAKKLYRDTEDKVIAGVCSGFACYLNIDAVWMRILFVILIIISYGFGIILYVILAILIPEAKTASQKLEMEGMPVTLETMKENAKDKEEDAKKKRSTLLIILAWPFKMLGKLVQVIVRFLLPLIRVLIGIFIALFSLGGMVSLSFFASMALTGNETYLGLPLTQILTTPLLYVTVIGGYFAVLLPLIVIFILAISLIRKKNMLHLKLGLSMLFIWLAFLVTAAVGGFQSADRLNTFIQNSPLFDEKVQEIPISLKPKQLIITEGIEVELIQGDEPKLIVRGLSNDLEYFDMEEENDTLILGRGNPSPFCLLCDFDGIKATLTLPEIDNINMKFGSNLEIEQWNTKNAFKLIMGSRSNAKINIKTSEISVSTEYGSNLELNVVADNAYFEGSEESNIELSGTLKEAEFTANYGGNIEAENINIKSVKATAAYGANIRLGEVEILEAYAEYGGTINYNGSPQLIKNEEKGGSIQSLEESGDSMNFLEEGDFPFEDEDWQEDSPYNALEVQDSYPADIINVEDGMLEEPPIPAEEFSEPTPEFSEPTPAHRS